MIDNNLPPHPGEILVEEFLDPLGLTQTKFAEKLGVPLQRINEIRSWPSRCHVGDGLALRRRIRNFS